MMLGLFRILPADPYALILKISWDYSKAFKILLTVLIFRLRLWANADLDVVPGFLTAKYEINLI